MSNDFDTFRKNLGLNLKEIRESNKISQFTLSLMSDLHKNYPLLIEKGKRNITIKVLHRLSIVLNTHPSIFFLNKETDKDIIDIINKRYKK